MASRLLLLVAASLAVHSAACVFDGSGIQPRPGDAPRGHEPRRADLVLGETPDLPDSSPAADAPRDRRPAADAKPDAKPKLDAKPDAKPKLDAKPDAKPKLDAKPDTKPKPDTVKPDTAKPKPDWWPVCSNCGCGKQCTSGQCVCKHFFCDNPPTAKQVADCAAIAAAESSMHVCKEGCCTGECGP